MKPSILPGIIRGLGKARIQFDKAYENRKIFAANSKQFSILEKIDIKNKDFSRTSLFKAYKLLSNSEFDEVIFWTFLKIIYSEENGGICVPKKELIDFIQSQNPKLDTEASWNRYLEKEKDNSLLVIEEDMVYLKNLYTTEKIVCEKLKNFFSTSFTEKFKEYKDKNLSEEQIQIVNSVFKNGISFLSGGPGTGKTTIIQSILRSALENKIQAADIAILAPTGKAAKRLQESCQALIQKYPELEPSTIHRFLKYSPRSGKFRFNAENILHHKLIILDEASMIDIFTLRALLEAYPNEDKTRRILFVGDPDQLLSVNTGSIFADFISLKRNLFILTQSFRQSEEGKEIKNLANHIKKLYAEDNVSLPTDIKIESDLNDIHNGIRFIQTKDDNESLKHACNWYNFLTIKKLIGQILTPYNETEIGVNQINSFIESNQKEKTSLPVIVTQNLYNLGIFNGETGRMIEDNNRYLFYPYGKEELEISDTNRQFFKTAYAITIHKSQGSEYDHVCLVLPTKEEEPDSLLNIRILYTAITRAKKSVTVIGSVALFQKALLNKGEIRHSRIASILKW